MRAPPAAMGRSREAQPGARVPTINAVPIARMANAAVTESVIRDVVLHWATRSELDVKTLLTLDFVFESEFESCSRDEFMAAVAVQAAWKSIAIRAILVDARHGAAFFEGVDPVTNLKYRVAWLLEHDSAKISRIVAHHHCFQR